MYQFLLGHCFSYISAIISAKRKRQNMLPSYLSSLSLSFIEAKVLFKFVDVYVADFDAM